MSKNITPSTLEGISRLAKTIKRKQGISHHEALEVAAVRAGFQNHRHAQHTLQTKSLVVAGHTIYLTSYWKDKDTKEYGRETLPLRIRRPLAELLKPAQLKQNSRLSVFRFEGPDHLAIRHLMRSQENARDRVCEAARTLQFMEATGLKPSGSSRAYPQSSPVFSIPGMDHASVWYDPSSKRYLLMDEPYEMAADAKQRERQAWAIQHNFKVALSEWPGMYNPEGGSRLYLISHAEKGVPLEPITAALARLHAPISPSPWQGESGPFPPPFVSPGAIARHEASKARQAMEAPRKPQKRNTVQYVNPIFGADRRPDAKMPIRAHQQIAGLMKTILADTYYRKGVYNKINSVRNQLDEWVQREYNRDELPDDAFHKLYYQDLRSNFNKQLSAASRQRHSDSMRKVKGILSEHYPDCAPLCRLIKKLDSAIASMDNWI
jgi:hypothetical protein